MATNDGGAGGGYVTRFLSAARAYVVVHEWRNWLFQCLIYSEVCCHSPSDRLAAHTSRGVIFVSLVSLYLFVVEDRVANCALYRASVLNFVCDIGTVLIIRSRNTHHVYVRVFHLIPRIISQVGFYKFSYRLVYFIVLWNVRKWRASNKLWTWLARWAVNALFFDLVLAIVKSLCFS